MVFSVSFIQASSRKDGSKSYHRTIEWPGLKRTTMTTHTAGSNTVGITHLANPDLHAAVRESMAEM